MDVDVVVVTGVVVSIGGVTDVILGPLWSYICGCF